MLALVVLRFARLNFGYELFEASSPMPFLFLLKPLALLLRQSYNHLRQLYPNTLDFVFSIHIVVMIEVEGLGASSRAPRIVKVILRAPLFLVRAALV
jgi:hypothetical protein